MRIGRSAVAPSVSLLLSAAVQAQTLRGVAVRSNDQPVGGVVMMLVDSGSAIVARTLTSERGEFRLTTTRAGSYRLQTLRIGFRSTISDPFALAAGTDSTTRVTLPDVPAGLDTIRATGRNVCRSVGDSRGSAFAVWEQVRSALMAAEIATATRALTAKTIIYERSFNPSTDRDPDRLLSQAINISTGYGTRLWPTLPPDSLRKYGYVVAGPNNSVLYHGPGLDMLLSNIFVQDHCFRLTSDKDGSPDVIGIAFEPASDRSKVPEVRGTLWLDRASSELRRLELGYANLPRTQVDNTRGEMTFTRARDGTWLVATWNLRMPVLEHDVRGIYEVFREELRVSGIQVAGGELAVVARGADTVWTHPPFRIAGILRDSAARSPIAGAHIALAGTAIQATTDPGGRFVLAGVVPGQYAVSIRTPSLDSMSASHEAAVTIADANELLEWVAPSGSAIAEAMCDGESLRDPAMGVIVGDTRSRRDSTKVRSFAGLHVVAELSEDRGATSRQVEARVLPDGTFRLCGVPTRASFTLRASADGAATAQPTTVTFSAGVRVARVSLVLDEQSSYFRDWPTGASPAEVGKRLAENWVKRPFLFEAGRVGTYDSFVHYAEVGAWYGALDVARLVRDNDLQQKLIRKFDFFRTPDGARRISPQRHVDFSVFGALPLELYLQTRDSAYLEQGLRFADLQWSDPTADGLTKEARYWIDDMFMITLLQVQAYRATGKREYVERAALAMPAYLKRLQQPNGLFFHGEKSPFFWGRGNGWMAAGMAELLRALPADSPHHAAILAGYRQMMATLLQHQAPNGLWRQLVDKPEVWVESSGSAMFAFAMATGVKEGWLDAAAYGPATRRAWLALVDVLDADGNVRDICVGTGLASDAHGPDLAAQYAYYVARPKQTGDPHGQAPLLWTAAALLR